MIFARLLLLLCLLFLTAAGPSSSPAPTNGPLGSDVLEESNMVTQGFKLSSPVFQQGEAIPLQYSMEADNEVPPLNWSGVPEGTRELALVVDDPDAPKGDPSVYPWVHWVVSGIPANVTSIQAAIQSGARQGVNSFGGSGWGGPLPPIDNGKHRYFFHLYALDAPLNLPAGTTKQQLMSAMEGHVLGVATLMGTYERTAQSAQVHKEKKRRTA